MADWFWSLLVSGCVVSVLCVHVFVCCHVLEPDGDQGEGGLGAGDHGEGGRETELPG